jgi:hypothetical protein
VTVRLGGIELDKVHAFALMQDAPDDLRGMIRWFDFPDPPSSRKK